MRTGDDEKAAQQFFKFAKYKYGFIVMNHESLLLGF